MTAHQEGKPASEQAYKSGFVAIIGRPNAGKSTLLNGILGQKIAITSEKPQTTRNSIRGIYTDAAMQAVFIDTPGVHKPKDKLDQRMMAAVTESLAGADLALYLVDATERFGRGEEYVMKILRHSGLPVFLLLNKIDRLSKEQLLPLISFFAGKDAAGEIFKEIIPISALQGENQDRLLQLLRQYLPPGPQYYAAETITDQPELMVTAELIREQVLRHTEQEVPHAVAVTVNAFEERPENKLYIEANIYVERDSQKGILIGKGGAMLKKIGTMARQELERFFACPVYLELRVKTKKDWRNNRGLLENWDLST